MAVTDLPDPDSPTTPTISPLPISSETWFRAWTSRENREAQMQVFNIEYRFGHYCLPPDFGSSRSRIPSPNRLKPGGNQNCRTGKAQYHHWSGRSYGPRPPSRPIRRWGCARPINPSVAAIRMALPISSDACDQRRQGVAQDVPADQMPAGGAKGAGGLNVGELTHHQGFARAPAARRTVCGQLQSPAWR